MKVVSEQFVEKLNEIIRPATKLYFELNTDVANPAKANYPEGGLLSFDYSVAPVKSPDYCDNGYYYAVLGDEKGVDDPNRICAPSKVLGEFPDADKTIPFGVTPYAAANTDVYIGAMSNYAFNFQAQNEPITISFKGGVIPEYITIQYYDFITGTWFEADTIHNENLDEEIEYIPQSDSAWGYFVNFIVKNTTKSGRYQLNWVRRNENAHISFTNDTIASVNIKKETDLTSQSFPSYEMTVVCLDINDSYYPHSIMWDNYFKEGVPCYFKVGFSGEGDIEYIPLMYGRLKQAPDYSDNKVTFKIAVDWNVAPNPVKTDSEPNLTNNVGDLVEGNYFYYFYRGSHVLFDEENIFIDEDDENDSVYNFYGVTEDARKMYANALGGYITADMNRFILNNTNMIQYRKFDGYLTRYAQVKNTLESKPKVGRIIVTRNENRTSEDYVDIQAPSTEFEPKGYTSIVFNIPFFAIGKIDFVELLPLGIEFDNLMQSDADDGTAYASLSFYSDSDDPIIFAPTVRFYRVDNTQFNETEIYEPDSTEVYSNNNDLITNTYIADKVKRVARFISGITEQYEVDVVQDFRLDLGDIIRLETKKNVFKTCIITGLKFVLPGSNGHITCRKIFALEDANKAINGAEGMVLKEEAREIGYRVNTSGDSLNIRATPHTSAAIIGSIQRNTRFYSNEIVEGDTVDGVNAWVAYEGGYVSGRYLDPIPTVPDQQPQTLTVLSTDTGSVVLGLVYDGLVGYEDVLIVLGGTSFEYQVGTGVPSTETYNLIVTDKNKHVWYFYFMPITQGYFLNISGKAIRLPDFTSGDPIGDCSAYGAINLIKAIYEEQGMIPPVDYTCDYHIIT